ncbi:hypothetical protein FHS44_005376 [Streptosporangium saharense]|uniref:Uncharacterized protein n=1 Tax=Streptosporangium saharense TaxID=1706840 RepID=A0A7W7QR90_9ACTN|nr:hypothetical protein [Streptosporangium saharense]
MNTLVGGLGFERTGAFGALGTEMPPRAETVQSPDHGTPTDSFPSPVFFP